MLLSEMSSILPFHTNYESYHANLFSVEEIYYMIDVLGMDQVVPKERERETTNFGNIDLSDPPKIELEAIPTPKIIDPPNEVNEIPLELITYSQFKTNTVPRQKKRAVRKKCSHESGCSRISRQGGLCYTHGKKSYCGFQGCQKTSQKRGLCATHGGVRVCSVKGCVRYDRGGGFCGRHRTEIACSSKALAKPHFRRIQSTNLKMKAASIQQMKRSTGIDASKLRIAICHTRWNQEVVDALVKGCVDTLLQENISQENIIVVSCGGAFELPLTAKMMIEKQNVNAVICIGCLIKGDTFHFEYISEAVSHGIMNLGLDTGIPVIYGVLNCLTEEQARFRAGLEADGHNHGKEWAQTAIEMAVLRTTTIV